MRFAVLAVILLSLPLVVSWLRASLSNRRYALVFLGTSFFLSGVLQFEISPISWPMWSGTVKGLTISMIDVVAIGLIVSRRRSPVKRELIVIRLAYIFLVVLSLLVSTVWMASLFYLFQVVRFMVLSLAISGEMRSRQSLVALLNGLAIGITVQAGYVVTEKLQGVLQAPGTMAHQNTLGMMVELGMIPLVGAMLGGEGGKLVKLGLLSGFVIAAGGGSRATIAIAVVSIALLIITSVVQRPTPTKAKMASLSVLAALLIAPLGYMTLSSRFSHSSVLAEDQLRIAMENAARAMASDHLFGVGANMYVTTANTGGYSDRFGVAWGGNTRAAPVHNAFLLARAETGWIGESIFILLFLYPAWVGFRFSSRFPASLDGTVALGSAVALCASAFHSQYEFAAQTVGPQGLIFINIGMISGLKQARRMLRPRQRQQASHLLTSNGKDVRGGAGSARTLGSYANGGL